MVAVAAIILLRLRLQLRILLRGMQAAVRPATVVATPATAVVRLVGITTRRTIRPIATRLRVLTMIRLRVPMTIPRRATPAAIRVTTVARPILAALAATLRAAVARAVVAAIAVSK